MPVVRQRVYDTFGGRDFSCRFHGRCCFVVRSTGQRTIATGEARDARDTIQLLPPNVWRTPPPTAAWIVFDFPLQSATYAAVFSGS